MAKAAQRSGAPRTGGTQGTAAARNSAQRTGAPGKGAQGKRAQGKGAQGKGAQQARPRRDGATPPAARVPAGPPAWLRWSTFALALLGLGVSAYLTYTHYTESALAGCTETSGAINCGKVTTSPQSIVFGIPVAVLGLAFYVFLAAIMSPYAWRSGRREIAVARLVSLVVGTGFVLYLLYAELFQIGSICLYCTSVHVITFLLFVLTGLAAAIWGLAPRPAVPAGRASPAGR
jgi:uncharacterized membrane protein